jgi:hypothetical protein
MNTDVGYVDATASPDGNARGCAAVLRLTNIVTLFLFSRLQDPQSLANDLAVFGSAMLGKLVGNS